MEYSQEQAYKKDDFVILLMHFKNTRVGEIQEVSKVKSGKRIDYSLTKFNWDDESKLFDAVIDFYERKLCVDSLLIKDDEVDETREAYVRKGQFEFYTYVDMCSGNIGFYTLKTDVESEKFCDELIITLGNNFYQPSKGLIR